MKAVVLANGDGAFLRPLNCSLSEYKLELLAKPVILGVLDNLLPLELSEIIIVVKYKVSQLEALFPEGEYKGVAVTLVIEEECFGSAGSVKNAVGETEECVLVVNGNAFFEFNLKEAKKRHVSNENDATILCKPVSEPREYGVVALGENNQITEFIEKPGWSEAFTNIANCNIFFLEPSVFKKIPENKLCDLKKDVFPKLLQEHCKIGAFVANDYWREIETIDDYKKVHFDIIGGVTKQKPPFVAENVFTETSVPKGNFVIIPPVYFGKNVQVESGAVIGPFTVIGEGSLVSKGSKIRESILLNNVYVSSGCSVNGALVSTGVSVKKGASVFENTVIGEESIIGEEAVIASGVLVWPNKTIENGVTVTENVKYSKPVNSVMQINDVIFGDFGVELTPEKTARLGAAIGSLFDGIRVGIGVDGEINSQSLKYGLLGGLISVGAKTFDLGECFFSQTFYFSSFCDVDVAIFISGGEGGVSLSLCEKGGIALSREALRKIELALKRNEFNRCSGEECQSVSVMNSIEQMYINEIVRQFENLKPSLGGVVCFTGNKNILSCVKTVLERLGLSEEAEAFLIKINNIGTKVTVVEGNNSFSHEKLLAVVAHNEMKNGNDVFLPWDAPQIITTLGAALGRKTYNFSQNGNAYNEAWQTKNVPINQLWSRDGVLLSFKIIKIMSEQKKSLSELVGELPEFYIAKKVMEIDVSPALIGKDLLSGNFKTEENGAITFLNEKGSAKVKCDSLGKRLKIITEAVSAELAKELCDEIEKCISIDIDR